MTDEDAPTVLGLDGFNVVIVGEGFPVDRVEFEEFRLAGSRPITTLKVPQVTQAQVDGFTLQLLPNRFEASAANSDPTIERQNALIDAAEYFIEQFTAKRSITAAGHNFLGDFQSAMGSPSSFMRFLAWPDKFAAVLPTVGEPTQSVLTKFRLDDDRVAQVRLEPSVTNPERVFYDVNISLELGAASSDAIVNFIRDLPRSLDLASGLISSLAELE